MCVCECMRDVVAFELLIVHKVYNYKQLSSGCVYLVQRCVCTICQCECIRSYQAGTLQHIPLLKAFYGCLYGRRAAVTGTGMERGDRAMVQRTRTVEMEWSWSLPWPSYTWVWQGGFALNWVTGEHTHTWNSKKKNMLFDAHTHTLFDMHMSEWDVIVQASWNKYKKTFH